MSCSSQLLVAHALSFPYLLTMTSTTVQFSSIAQVCPTLCDPMDCSIPGFLIYHQLSELAQIHVHWVSVSIQPSHSLSSPSPPTSNHSQHQSLFKWVSSSHQVAKVLAFQLQHQSFQWIFRTDLLQDWLDLLAVQGTLLVFSNTTVQKHQFFSAQLFYSPTLTSIPDHWKNHSLD